MDIEVISGFVSPDKSKKLVDGKVDGIKNETHFGRSDRWHESPGRVMSPLHLGTVFTTGHKRTDKPEMLHGHGHLIAIRHKRVPVVIERFDNPFLRVVEVVEVIAKPLGIGFKMKSCAPSKVAVRRSIT
jgi:hypothetical protein